MAKTTLTPQHCPWGAGGGDFHLSKIERDFAPGDVGAIVDARCWSGGSLSKVGRGTSAIDVTALPVGVLVGEIVVEG